MKQHPRYLFALISAFALLTGFQPATLAQREWREYEPFEYHENEALPADYQVPGEFVTGRLMYPSGVSMGWGGRSNWQRGGTELGGGLSRR